MQTSPGFNQVYPGQAIAICSRAQAAQLADYDHHTTPDAFQTLVDGLKFQFRGQAR